jgi:hypothetical protein
VESFVLMPLATMSLPFGGLPTAALDLAKTAENAPQAVLSQKLNIQASDQIVSNPTDHVDALTREAKADAIDTYFKSKNMPLAGHGMGMVLAAEKYNMDWRLLAAISVRETTGGRHACPYTYERTGDIGYKYNVFGWGSCKIRFQSYEHGFETVARNLSGNNPKTAHYYAGKDTISILESYNPRTVVAHYPEQVVAIMDNIGDKEMGLTLVLAK